LAEQVIARIRQQKHDVVKKKAEEKLHWGARGWEVSVPFDLIRGRLPRVPATDKKNGLRERFPRTKYANRR